jgi:hypothetical protein
MALLYSSAEEGICTKIDVAAYMKVGYIAQCHCRLDSALDYVKQQMEMDARANNETIEVEIAPGLWAPSGYYWEEDTLFKKAE